MINRVSLPSLTFDFHYLLYSSHRFRKKFAFFNHLESSYFLLEWVLSLVFLLSLLLLCIHFFSILITSSCSRPLRFYTRIAYIFRPSLWSTFEDEWQGGCTVPPLWLFRCFGLPWNWTIHVFWLILKFDGSPG